MRDYSLHEEMVMPDEDFPIRVFDVEYDHTGPVFSPHWHEQLEILYFVAGEAVVECGSQSCQVGAGDLVVVNSNELHACSWGDFVRYCVIIVDLSLLQSSFSDSCDLKYIGPIAQNLILFQNKISGEDRIAGRLREIVAEYTARRPAYELAIKAEIYGMLTILLRSYVARILTAAEYRSRIRNLEQLREVLKYIAHHLTRELTVDDLARLAHLSRYHFCRVFKRVTGRTVMDYINYKRVIHAERLLKTTRMSVTEISLASGFNDSNYFSRVFRKYRKYSPSAIRTGGQGSPLAIKEPRLLQGERRGSDG